jgi:hypothetical protein
MPIYTPQGLTMLKAHLAQLRAQKADLERLINENNFHLMTNGRDETPGIVAKLNELIGECAAEIARGDY